MFLKRFENLEEFVSGDNCRLREYFNPLKEKMELNYSLAHAIVKPGETTFKHKLKSSEVYFILKGKGIMRIDEKQKEVKENDVIYIPPNSVQSIKNNGEEDLVFLAIVEPAWKKEDEKIIKED